MSSEQVLEHFSNKWIEELDGHDDNPFIAALRIIENARILGESFSKLHNIPFFIDLYFFVSTGEVLFEPQNRRELESILLVIMKFLVHQRS